METKEEILTMMAEKYRSGTKLSAIVNEDERRALDETTLEEIATANYPKLILELKLESLYEFLKYLEHEMGDPNKFNPTLSMYSTLFEIVTRGTKSLAKEGSRILQMFVSIVTNDIERKYHTETPILQLSRFEWQVLKDIRPLYFSYHNSETVLALHWKIIEKELDEDIERLDTDPEYEVESMKKLIRFVSDIHVPEKTKTKARELRRKNESVVIKRLPQKYTVESRVDELTETERNVLDRLDVIRNDYDQVVEYLHWEVTDATLSEEYEKFKGGNLEGKHWIPKKVDFLATNERVPAKIQQKAELFRRELQQDM